MGPTDRWSGVFQIQSTAAALSCTVWCESAWTGMEEGEGPICIGDAGERPLDILRKQYGERTAVSVWVTEFGLSFQRHKKLCTQQDKFVAYLIEALCCWGLWHRESHNPDLYIRAWRTKKSKHFKPWFRGSIHRQRRRSNALARLNRKHAYNEGGVLTRTSIDSEYNNNTREYTIHCNTSSSKAASLHFLEQGRILNKIARFHRQFLQIAGQYEGSQVFFRSREENLHWKTHSIWQHMNGN